VRVREGGLDLIGFISGSGMTIDEVNITLCKKYAV
jgi:hypothetical protein